MKEKPIREGAKLQGANPCPHIFRGENRNDIEAEFARQLKEDRQWKSSIPKDMQPFLDIAKMIDNWSTEIFNYIVLVYQFHNYLKLLREMNFNISLFIFHS